MEINEPTGHTSTQSSLDPETGKISWDIKYKADYALVYKRFKDLNKAFKDFTTYDEVRKDSKLMEMNSKFNSLYNIFRTHIRKNYPKQYKMLQTIDESLVKELIRNKLKEISVTGAGAGASTFTTGESENISIPKAFKYKLSPQKSLKEDESTKSYINSLNLPDPTLTQFIETRITDFDKIEDKLNILLPLLKKAKTETMEYYKTNPNFQVKYGTDLAVDYIDDIITLFKDKK
jgi:hypothetical protein